MVTNEQFTQEGPDFPHSRFSIPPLDSRGALHAWCISIPLGGISNDQPDHAAGQHDLEVITVLKTRYTKGQKQSNRESEQHSPCN